MPSITLEVLIILVLLLANGVFAMSEIAVVSARKAWLQKHANEGDKGAQAALELANSPSHFLSTVQIGITLIGVMAGAFGGTTLAKPLALYLQTIPWLTAYSTPISLGVVVVCITFVSLLLGELVPKRLALHRPEQIASLAAIPMRLLSHLAGPLVGLLVFITDSLLRILGLRSNQESPVTEEEVKVLIDQGTKEGTFEQAERDMVKRVFRLGDRRVASLMTPRRDIVWLDVEDSIEEVQRKLIDSTHSRFLVAEGHLDNLAGVVYAKDLLAKTLAGIPLDLRSILRQPLVIPESTVALNLLESFKQSGTHIALIVDEHGGVQGLVTLNDVLEAIVGDISSIDAQTEPAVVKREDGSLLLDGMLRIDDLKAILQVSALPGEQNGYYHTLAGFIMMKMGRIPSAADHFNWGGFRFEVVDMDGRRIDKVMVMPPPRDSAAVPEEKDESR